MNLSSPPPTTPPPPFVTLRQLLAPTTHNATLADYAQYAAHDLWREFGDRRVAHLPLLRDGPSPVVAVVAAYVLLVTWLGPRLMRHRKPFTLRWPMIAHNALLAVG